MLASPKSKSCAIKSGTEPQECLRFSWSCSRRGRSAAEFHERAANIPQQQAVYEKPIGGYGLVLSSFRRGAGFALSFDTAAYRRGKETSMQRINTILVPTDFSAASDRVLAYARDIADAFGATLHLLHVFDNPFAAGAFMDMYTRAPGEYVERIERQTLTRLETLLTPEQKAKYIPIFAARMGPPAQQILQYAEEHGAIDVIVLATGGHGRVARLILGSVADKIVRTAPCPVLTVHPHDRAENSEASQAA
jgi:universal stress protein A